MAVASIAWIAAAAPAIACLADGAVAVSLNLSKANCEAGPKHVNNAACCSGKASPVWNANTNKCDTTCDSSAPCAYVVCTALSACHNVGVCDPATGICSNPTKPDNTVCSDGNSCTNGDKCVSGACVKGPTKRGCCGNGIVETGEACDDGNQSALTDGCKQNCTLDAGWVCSGSPSSCCVGDDQVRFEIPGVSQNTCNSMPVTADAGCCQGSHKGLWTGGKCYLQCTLNKCNPPPAYGTSADYGCFTKDCYDTSACQPLTGCTQTPKNAGSACGSAATTSCSNPDSCNASGTCLPNHKALGTVCSSGAQCNFMKCDGAGACADASNTLNGTGCNDGLLCTTSDQCQGGVCAGAPKTCPPFDGCHLAGECDPATGFCSAPPAPAGTPCGTLEPLHEDCDLPDSCSGDGSCLSNAFPDNLPCGEPTGTCFSEKSCADGGCDGGPVQLEEGAACGDDATSGCDEPDSCDVDGKCLTNWLDDGTACGGEGACTTASTCADGVCAGASNKPEGTACGDVDSLGDCDAGDTCDGAGSCQPNLDSTTVCRPDAGVCDVAETCNGVDPACPADAFEPEGTSCDDLATCAPDICDAAGSCQPATKGGCSTTSTIIGSTTTTLVGNTTTTVLGNTTSTTLLGNTTTTVFGNTTTTLDGATTTSTTLPADVCAAYTGLPHAACLLSVAINGQLCADPTPPKLENALRVKLTKAADRIDAAIGSDGKKQAKLVKKGRALVIAAGKKAASAAKVKQPAKQITPACAGEIAALVSAILADLS